MFTACTSLTVIEAQGALEMAFVKAAFFWARNVFPASSIQRYTNRLPLKRESYTKSSSVYRFISSS